MASGSLADSYVSLISLREIRRYIVRSHAVMMSVFFGVVYALVSLDLSGMLILAPLRGGYTTLLVTAPSTGPGLLIIAPWGILSLPFFGVVSMALVCVGVALGMATAVLLAVAVARRRSDRSAGPATVGTLAGLTPAMIALLALGACCSTTAAATAGIGVIAQVSGSSTDTLLANSWYLSVFQLAIVWVALIAQEALLRAYGGLFGRPAAVAAPPAAPAPAATRRAVTGAAFRAALLIAGVSWSLAMFADWTTVAPATASAATWFDWVVVHQFASALAVTAALFPAATSRFFRTFGSSLSVRLVRGLSLVAGIFLILGAPPPLAGAGLEGWGNELLYQLGAPAAWGAVAPVYGPGAALAFRWGFQYLLLGAFALAVASRPALALAPGRWSASSDPLGFAAPAPDVEAGRATSI